MSAKYDARIAGALAAGTPNLEGVDGYPAALAWLSSGTGDLSGVPETVALSAIEAAVRLRKSDRLAALENGPKAMRKAGRAGLHRLKAAGVVVEAPRQAASFTLSAETVNVPPRAVMSHPDISGHTQIAMACTDAEGTCAVIGIFGGAEGVRKLEHGHLSRGSARKFFEELTAQQGVLEVPFAHALHHALANIEVARAKGAVPHEWDHFSEHLTAQHLAAAAAYSPLGELPEVAEEGRLEASDALEPLLGGIPWSVSSAAFHALDSALEPMHLADSVAEAINQGEDPEAVAAEQAPAQDDAQAEQAEGAGEDQPDAPDNSENMFMDAIRAASAKVLDDADVRADWQSRLELFATLFRRIGATENLADLQHIAAALRDNVPAERIGLSRAMIRTALFASMMQRQSEPEELEG